MTVSLNVWKDYQGAIQVEIGDENGGYRILGPSFVGRSVKLASHVLDKHDAERIRDYLAFVEEAE